VDDRLVVALIAAACAGLVGLAGLLLVPVLRRASVLAAFVAVAVVAVGGFVAGLLGTASAMFLSAHDFGVVLLVCLVAGVVSVLVACLLAVPVVRGSRGLCEAARRLGETGEYDEPVRPPPTTELRGLSAELRTAAQRLAAARDRQVAAEQSRRRLVAWVSHDLRTPLASLRAMAEALEDGLVDDPDRFYRQMRVEVDRTAGLVDDLFALSRIHADALLLELEPVDLGDVISDSLAVAEPLSAERGVRLTGESEPGLVLRADPRHLHRMLANLLGNAIRHTTPGLAVRVAAREDGSDVVLAVADGCGGIPPARMGGLFEAGLGLGIVRGIVQAHGGAVGVRNAGQGCVFEVRLPAGTA
jgi:signal transduction histidine kinase